MFVTVVCPSPSCPRRHVEGESVERETWEAKWNEALLGETGALAEWDADISCPACGTDGVAADDEAGIDMREEELGTRCPSCGVVSFQRLAPLVPECPHCNAPMTMACQSCGERTPYTPLGLCGSCQQAEDRERAGL